MPIAIELNPGPYLLKDYFAMGSVKLSKEEFEKTGKEAFLRFVGNYPRDVMNELPALSDLIRRVWWEEELKT